MPVPAVSVIMPVYNGSRFLKRAVQSLHAQQMHAWELLAVDDGSRDDSHERLLGFAAKDPRIRVFQQRMNLGPCPARNLAARHAQAPLITYLDCDDEYYVDYLTHVVGRLADVEVLVSAYDVLEERRQAPGYGQVYTWNPGNFRERLMHEHIAVPLGIAHRKEALNRVGFFSETWYVEGESDLLRRMARAGLRFEFSSVRSGRYHARADGRGRTRSIPEAIRRQFPALDRPPATVAERTCQLVGWEPNRSCWGDDELMRPGRKLLFCSYHSYLDTSNGASLCTRDLFENLTERGWHCRVFSGPHLDFEHHVALEQLLADEQLHYRLETGQAGPIPFSLYRFDQRDVPVVIYSSPMARQRHKPTREEGYVFLNLLENLLDRFRPDLLLTYGGHWLARAVVECAKSRQIPVVFALHNLAYGDAGLFKGLDAVLVPSQLAQEHYRRKLGLACTAIPGPWNLQRIQCGTHERKYVTFVNPQPLKGVYLFVRIVHEMWQRRPDIPFLVVEGRGKASWLTQTGLDLRGVNNLSVMANTPDPRDFYRVSKIVLMPSLGLESFPRVAVEAQLNGIPVVASRRGGLIETLDGAGFLIDVPAKFTASSQEVASAEDAAPWVDTIIRLWDDPGYYEEHRQRALAAAESWRPAALMPRFEQFIERCLARQDAPLVSDNDLQQLGLAFSQAQASRDQMTATQYFRIVSEVSRRAPCRLLVFGAGRDTELYVRANPGGRTFVLEDDFTWIEQVRRLDFTVIPVSYQTRVGRGLQEPCPLPGDVPEALLREHWDVVIVDGPAGHDADSPGRQQSIHMASLLAKPGTTVYLHDAERPLEQECAAKYLKPPDEQWGEERMLLVFRY